MATIKITGRDSSSAMDEISKKLGADAFILSTKSIENGIEIEATNDPLEVKKKVTTKKSFTREINKHLIKENKPNAITRRNYSANEISHLSKANGAPNFEDDMEKISNTLESLIDDLRGMFITDSNGLGVEIGQTTAVKLSRANFDPRIVKRLSPSFDGLNFERGRASFMRALAEKLSFSEDTQEIPELTFVTGMSGSGKSTLVAKLAARYSSFSKKTNFVLASLESTNNLGNESLRSHARMLNFPLLKFTPETFIQNISAINEKIIVDVSVDAETACKVFSEYESLSQRKNVTAIVTVGGGASRKSIKNQFELFEAIKPVIALTKLDECSISAEEISEFVLKKLKICYLSGSKAIISELAVSNKEILMQYLLDNC